MEILNSYIVVIVAAICYGVGIILKNFVPMDNKFIPLAMGVLGIVLNWWVNNFAFSPEILLGGLASGLVATGGDQLLKKTTTAVKELFEKQVK